MWQVQAKGKRTSKDGGGGGRRSPGGGPAVASHPGGIKVPMLLASFCNAFAAVSPKLHRTITAAPVMHTCAAPVTQCPVPPLPPQVPANILTLMCELCGGGQHEEAMILCDACDRGCHLFCLNPPLASVPEGAWTCPLCVGEAHAQVRGSRPQSVRRGREERTLRALKSKTPGPLPLV